MTGVASISAIASALPEKVLDNETLAHQFPEWTAQKILDKTGIRARRIAADNETAADLAALAAENLFKKQGIDRAVVDYLLFCTQTPDYLLPSSACLIHQQIGLRKNCAALDLNMGCSGYIYGLSLAKGLIESGIANTVLLLTGDTYSKLISHDDRSVRPLFGDAATATLITKELSDTPLLDHFVFGTDGNGASNLIVHDSACRGMTEKMAEEFHDHAGMLRSTSRLYMDGPEIMRFTLQTIPALCQQTLEAAGTSWSQIDQVVFHQANRFLLDALRKKIGIPPEKMIIEMEDVGNTVSSSIPLAIASAIRKGWNTEDNTLLLVGFGVGYSWAACQVKIKKPIQVN